MKESVKNDIIKKFNEWWNKKKQWNEGKQNVIIKQWINEEKKHQWNEGKRKEWYNKGINKRRNKRTKKWKKIKGYYNKEINN